MGWASEVIIRTHALQERCKTPPRAGVRGGAAFQRRVNVCFGPCRAGCIDPENRRRRQKANVKYNAEGTGTRNVKNGQVVSGSWRFIHPPGQALQPS
jgi:hypothetical protein